MSFDWDVFWEKYDARLREAAQGLGLVVDDREGLEELVKMRIDSVHLVRAKQAVSGGLSYDFAIE